MSQLAWASVWECPRPFDSGFRWQSEPTAVVANPARGEWNRPIVAARQCVGDLIDCHLSLLTTCRAPDHRYRGVLGARLDPWPLSQRRLHDRCHERSRGCGDRRDQETHVRRPRQLTYDLCRTFRRRSRPSIVSEPYMPLTPVRRTYRPFVLQIHSPIIALRPWLLVGPAFTMAPERLRRFLVGDDSGAVAPAGYSDVRE
jgi:hypothetical protein